MKTPAKVYVALVKIDGEPRIAGAFISRIDALEEMYNNLQITEEAQTLRILDTLDDGFFIQMAFVKGYQPEQENKPIDI